MARAVVEGQAFAHLAMIASDRQDERWLCDVEQAARARSSEQLRLEISSLREGAAPGADAADAPKSALVLAQLTARGVAPGAVDAAAIAAELKAQDGHVGRTVNRLMNRRRSVEAAERAAAEAPAAAKAPATLARRPSMDARLKQEAAKRDSAAEVTPLLVEAAAPVAAKAPSTLARRPSMDARLKQEAAKRDSPAEVTPPLVEAAAPVEAAEAGDAVGAAVAALAP